MTVGPDRRIFAADGQALTIRVFGPDGAFLRSIGREGEGPGEFQSIDGLAYHAVDETLVARDPLLNRVSLFDSAGVFQRSFTLSRPFAQFARRTSLWVDGKGRIYDLTQLGTTPSVDSIGVVSYASDGRILQTTAIAVSNPGRLLLRASDGAPRAAALLPFTAFARGAVSPAGQVIGGTGDEYRIGVFEEGALIRIVRKDATSLPVPAWAADTVEAIVLRLLENQPDGTVDRDDLSNEQPYYNFLLVDALGFTWVARHGLDYGPTGRHEIFDPAGRYRGWIATPLLLVDEVGVDYVAGRQVDDLGVERIVVLPLMRNSP